MLSGTMLVQVHLVKKMQLFRKNFYFEDEHVRRRTDKDVQLSRRLGGVEVSPLPDVMLMHNAGSPATPNTIRCTESH